MKTLLGALALAPTLTASLLLAATPVVVQAEARTNIIASEFGVFEGADFRPSRTVSLAKKQGYGWMMVVDTPKAEVRYREEFILPASATWKGAPGQGVTVSADGRSAVSERVVRHDDGMIFNTWSVAEGDPKGRYMIKVLLEGQVEKTFVFDVE
ncbi:hypothetical protein [Phenylobacterium sp.]|jgi:hypothetical protein|uniref:hypothetical protein n=1 Tax=Phenylobacterium sp. TaxID=1871053 RepID=UPI0037852714